MLPEHATDINAIVRDFITATRFLDHGAVITDLDGTVVHEAHGRGCIDPRVEAGLTAVCAAGRPVLVNTLRFPLSVMRVFGTEWHRITGAPIPLVSLNGSQVGIISPKADGSLGFEPLESAPLLAEDIGELMQGVRGIVAAGDDDLLVFFYPEDWRQGEVIWTPATDLRAQVADRYRSASTVLAGDADLLEQALRAQPVVLVFLLVHHPDDRRMAYQHTERTRFVTRAGVDKRHGAEVLARHLGFDLADCIGAGDAPTDNFLNAVGLALIVGEGALEYRGRHATVRVPAPADFGDLMVELGAAVAASKAE